MNISSRKTRLNAGHSRFVVEEVMRQVVADVAEEATTEDCSRNIPIPVKHKVCKSVKWDRKYNEESRWHDQAELIHW